MPLRPRRGIGSILIAGLSVALASTLGIAAPAGASTMPASAASVTSATSSTAHLPAASALPKVDLKARAHAALAHVALEARETMPQRHRGVRTAPATSGLLYNGGPVAHYPRVYLLFWGSQWSSDPNGVESYMYYYFNSLGLSSDYWSPTTSQYSDYTGLSPSFSGAVFAGWAQDTSAAPSYASQAQLAAEAAAGADYFGSTGTDSQVIVLSPTGTHPDNFPNAGWCAYHSYTYDSSGNFVAWTNMPYVLDAGGGCGAYSVSGALDGFSIVSGHEYAETMTDPAINAWYDSNGEEIGDLCAWNGLFLQGTPYGSFAQQPLWSNAAFSCVQ